MEKIEYNKINRIVLLVFLQLMVKRKGIKIRLKKQNQYLGSD